MYVVCELSQSQFSRAQCMLFVSCHNLSSVGPSDLLFVSCHNLSSVGPSDLLFVSCHNLSSVGPSVCCL